MRESSCVYTSNSPLEIRVSQLGGRQLTLSAKNLLGVERRREKRRDPNEVFTRRVLQLFTPAIVFCTNMQIRIESTACFFSIPGIYPKSCRLEKGRVPLREMLKPVFARLLFAGL